MRQIEEEQLQSDWAVFLRNNRHKRRETFVLVLVYVDNMIFVGKIAEPEKDSIRRFLS